MAREPAPRGATLEEARALGVAWVEATGRARALWPGMVLAREADMLRLTRYAGMLWRPGRVESLRLAGLDLPGGERPDSSDVVVVPDLREPATLGAATAALREIGRCPAFCASWSSAHGAWYARDGDDQVEWAPEAGQGPGVPLGPLDTEAACVVTAAQALLGARR